MKSVVGEKYDALSQDDMENYNFLLGLVDKFNTEGAVLYFKSKEAREPLSAMRTMVLSAAEMVHNLDVNRTAKLLFAAIILGENSLVTHQYSLETYPKGK